MTRWMTVLIVAGLMLPLLGHTNIAVRPTNEGVEVGVEATRVAVFQPSPHEVWIVAEQGRLVGELPSRTGWTIEPLQVSGGVGIKITTPAPRAWRVQPEVGGFRVMLGEGGVASGASALVLRDGLAGGLPVQDNAGQRFWVKPTAQGGLAKNVAAGVVPTVQGVAMKVDGAPALARVKDVGVAPTPQTVSTKPAKSLEKLASLPPVATPIGLAAVKMEDIAPAAGPAEVDISPSLLSPDVSALGVYVPGTLVSFTLPEGYRLERGRLLRSTLDEVEAKRRAFARTMGALDAASSRLGSTQGRVDDVLNREPESALPNIPLVSTAASIAKELEERGETVTDTAIPPMPSFEDEMAQLQSQDEGGEMFPATGRTRAYWHGLTVRLAVLARAMDKAGARIATRDEAPVDAAAIEPHAGGGSKKEPAPDLPPFAPWKKEPAEVLGNVAVLEARRDLVKYYLAWNRPHEALLEIAQLPKREDGLPQMAEDRFDMALAYVARHQPAKALPLLQADASTLPQHRALWRAVALQQTGREAEAMRIWPLSFENMLAGYPAYLRTMAMESRGEVLAKVGKPEDLRMFADGWAEQFPIGTVPAGVMRLQGLARLQTRDEQRGLEYLAAAAGDETNPLQAYPAKFAFVMALQRRGELEDRQVATYLEELRLFWRGDELEQTVLNQLGETYLRQRDYRRSLGRWQTLVRAFPKYTGMAALTDKMTAAAVGIFDPENPEVYDALTYLGLYFDFKALLPSDTRGDRAMEMAGRLLAEQGLPERAIPVLEQVLQYRAEAPIDKARVALLLADAYRVNGKPDWALKTLDQHKPNAINTVQQKNWPLAEARALLALNRPHDALKALQDSTEEEAPWLRSDAAWELADWAYLEEVLRPLVRRLTPESLPNNRANQVAVLRLAYALGQKQDRAELEALLERFGPAARDLPTMADAMAAMATQSGVAKVEDAARPLARVASGLAGLNDYTDRFRQREAEVRKRVEEREDFNNKMKFNELLPPPVGL